MAQSFAGQKRAGKLPLHTVLLTPLVGLAVLAVVLVGYFSYHNGQNVVRGMTYQLQSEINQRIKEHLVAFVYAPYQINASNAKALRRGSLDVQNKEALMERFWDQVQAFDSVTSINFGNIEGGLANAGREGMGGAFYIIYTEGFERGPFYKYATDEEGRAVELLQTLPHFDSTERAWYYDALSATEDSWSPIYAAITGQDLTITASRLVYDEEGQLLGVIATNLFLGQLGEFLKGLEVSETGLAFIMERSGRLVATSTADRSFSLEEGALVRLFATESGHPKISQAAEAFFATGAEPANLEAPLTFSFLAEGKKQIAQVRSFQQGRGLDWLIVTVIPEEDFMGQIRRSNRTTFIFALFTLLLLALITIEVTRKILEPIAKLEASAQAIVKGEWEKTPEQYSFIKEISTLGLSFNHMVQEVEKTVEGLTKEILERKKAEEALLDSEAKLRALFSAMTEMVALCELVLNEDNQPVNYRIMDCNEAYCQMIGFTKGQLVGQLVTDFQDTQEVSHLKEFSLVAISGKPYRFETYSPKLARHFSISVVSPTKGKFATVLTDITQLKESQATIDAKNKELEQLVYVASHDLRSPLVNVDGYSKELEYVVADLEVSLSDPSLNQESLGKVVTRSLKEMREALNFIRCSTKHMDGLLKGLLVVSRTGRTKLALEYLNMEELIRNVIAAAEFQIRAQGVEILLNDLPPCRGDGVQIAQVFANLIDNSLKFKDPQRPLQIEITGRQEEGRSVYCVRDTGMGIAREHQKNIFELFHRLNPKETKGEGLGLTIVKQIVTRLQGAIWVESEVGVGSSFYVELPSPKTKKQKPSPLE